VDRSAIVGEMASVLHILHSSVKKHLSDKNFDGLKWRIDWTLDEFYRVSVELGRCGFWGVVKFICNCANYLVPYARLAMSELVVSWTNNMILRLMGELGSVFGISGCIGRCVGFWLCSIFC
jgi:hypothetical protein